MNPVRRLLLWSLVALLLVCGLLLGALGWAVRSDSGSRQLLQWVLAAASPAGTELAARQIDGNLLYGLRLQGLQFAATDGSAALRLQTLEFSWEPWQLLQRSLSLGSLHIEGLQWESRGETAPTAEPFDAAVITRWFAALPLDVDLEQVDLQDLQFVVGATTVQVPELRFKASLDRQRLVLRELELLAYDTRVEGGLALEQDLGLQGRLAWQRGPDAALAGEMQVTGTLPELQMQHELRAPLAVQSQGLLATGLAAGTELRFELRHRISALDLAQWGVPELVVSDLDLLTTGTPLAVDAELALQAQYRDFAPLALRSAALWTPDSLRLDSADLRSEELDLGLQGTWDFATRALDLQWDLTRLDLARGGVDLAAVQGAGSAALLLQDAAVSGRFLAGPLQGQLNAHDFVLETELQLQDSAVQTLALDLRSADNRLQLAGAVQPALDVQWTLDVPLLAQLHPALAGQLAGSGGISGSLEAPVLSGALQGRELALLQGEARWSLQQLQLQAAGDGDGNGLTLQADGLALQRPGSTTALADTARIRLDGSPAAHELDLQLAAMDGTFELVLAGALGDETWQGRVQRAALAAPSGTWVPGAPFGVAWQNGALRIDEHCWSGAPPELCLSLAAGAAAEYELGLDIRNLPLAWLNRGDAAPGKPLVLQELQSSRGLDLPAGLAVLGSAALTAKVEGPLAWPPTALQAALATSNLELQFTRAAETGEEAAVADIQRFAVAAEPLRVALASGAWRASTNMEITQLPDVAAAGSDAALQGSLGADLTLDAAARLGGALRLSFADLAFVESLVPGLQEPAGRLQGTATLSGTLAEPEVDTDLTVSQGAFSLPGLGISVSDFGAQLRGDSTTLALRASGVSGAGELVLQASILRPFANDRQLSARLEGSNFTLLDIATASATVSPAVDLNYTDGVLALQGSVELPAAALDLQTVVEDVAEGGVGISRDAVVVQPDSTALVAEQQRALPFNAALDLKLGESVRVRGFGLDLALNGELRLEQEAGRALLAYGELGIPEGTYRIYNQELNARDGRLLFYGNPLNPVLDVRAFRETSAAEVGMLLSGTLDRMESRLYSTPALPDNEILAMLITGKSFNNMNDEDGSALLSAIAGFGIERGEGLTSMIGNKLGLDSVAINRGDTYLQSSLGIGKYITPDLLMRYEIGIFDRQVVLSIDYRLSERIRLEVRSGLSQSVDVSYTIEKD